MHIVIYLSLLVCILGFILWMLLSPAPRKAVLAEACKLAYFAGLLAFLMTVGALIETCSGDMSAPTHHGR